ncbi:glycosyltransferase [Macrococcoides caseolyticum]|uniref:glycosyltransferase n=1 Tax=Macrococcoides caseolyticum TaxID=69966 RepID=UPI00105C394B|nr:glycosyltransferase [Macrococcus caseolyticus]TDM27181.1 glycosyltransferase [Macrococcus caseolyticus]
MIYTVASTLPPVHGGRTKSLLNRINFLDDEFDFEQTILTTNYNPNYNSVYKIFYDKKILKENIKIINLYDWLSGFQLLTKPSKSFLFINKSNNKIQNIKISNYIIEKDSDNNCERYYDKDTGKYLLYRKFYSDSNIVKFEDYFVQGVKHKVERWEYNEEGYLHRITNYSRKLNKKLAEFFYDLKERLYCKKYYEETNDNKLIGIFIYSNGTLVESFNNEKDLFTYFFDFNFSDQDIIFNDARLLDKSLINSTKKIKPILVFHSSHFEGENIKGSYKLALNNPDKIAKYYVLTNHQKEDIQNDFNIPDEKFKVIPHFINAPKDIINDKKDQFVFMGRFSEEKQISHIIESYKLYKEKGYKTKLVLYGGVKGEERTKIENLIEKYNLKNEVTIQEFTNNPAQVFRESKASLLTSKFEGFPLSIMESINEGCPVIAYDIRYGPREIIVNGENGYLIEPNNIEQFAEAMISISESPLENVKTKEGITYQAAINNFDSLIKTVTS